MTIVMIIVVVIILVLISIVIRLVIVIRVMWEARSRFPPLAKVPKRSLPCEAKVWGSSEYLWLRPALVYIYTCVSYIYIYVRVNILCLHRSIYIYTCLSTK